MTGRCCAAEFGDNSAGLPADHYGGLVVFPLIDHSCDVWMIAQLAQYPSFPRAHRQPVRRESA
jgi:hypothetical protein